MEDQDHLTTQHLCLRPWAAHDLAAAVRLLRDPKVMEFSDHGPLDTEDVRRWLAHASSGTPRALPGYLAIERRSDQRVIGYVSLTQDPARCADGEAELGIRLIYDAWGYGFAKEAAHAVITAAGEIEGLERIIAIVDPHNGRSLKLLQTLGMVQRGEVMFEGYDYPDRVYGIETAIAGS